MKILITGYTTRMFGSDRVNMDYVTFSFLLEDILKEMGHEVNRRKILIGEELWKEYDFAFCGVAPLSSMTSGRVPETHYAMSAMRGRYAVYADDWSFCGFGDSVRYALDRWEQYTRYKNFPYSSEIIEETRQSLEMMVHVDKTMNAPVLAPMFSWGDHQFLMRGTEGKPNYDAKLITIDPSKWLKFPTVEIPEPFDKKKQWVMAALSDHKAWIKRQKFKLPVVYVGNKRMDCLILTETQTVRLFAESYGVLSTGYPSAGSGWWRTRYHNAAWAESLIYSDPKDAAIMGRAYQGSAEYFENLSSETEYKELVAEQTFWLNANTTSKDIVMQTMDRLISR